MASKFKFAALAGLLLLSVSAFAVVIPKGTGVKLAFDKAVSSKSAKVGDKVEFTVVDEVIVNGQVVVKKGATATGVVESVEKGRRFGVNARLKIALNPITAADGTEIPLQPRGKGKKLGGGTDKAAIASGAGLLVLGPVGAVAGFFVTGKHVNVKPGDTMLTEVSADTTTKS